ncbi:MAG: motif domain protein [Myxococcaceae bacterium]|nr:motif domain protein [Myxococcaceae bacterium]
MSAEASRCPCGGGEYPSCCGPRHTGAAPAPTAEALMRSRYSAYVRGLAGYLAATQRAPLDEKGTLSWAGSVKWLGLTVHFAKGGEGDGAGEVEFTARYLAGERLCSLHERSAFERDGGRWLYTTGTPEHSEQKVERNAPCPCGSGRKFKRCCA